MYIICLYMAVCALSVDIERLRGVDCEPVFVYNKRCSHSDDQYKF